MSKYFKLLLIFSTILLILSYSLDYIISAGLRKTDLRKFQAWNDIYNSNIHSNAVILGSSRAWCQYSPQIMDSVINMNFYNLGIDGHKIDYQILRYNTYRRFYPKPQLIIHNVEFSTLGLTEDGYDREQFFPYIFDDSLINKICKIKKITFFDRKLPLVRYFGYHELIKDGISAYFGKKVLPDGGLVKGYRGNNYPWDGKTLNKIKDIHFEKNPEAIKMFDDYLKKTKEEGIKVILVFAPIYYEGAKKISDKKGLYNLYENIAKKYDISILDFTNDSITLDKSNFYNATHLNKVGSEKFSLKLAKKLKTTLRNQ